VANTEEITVLSLCAGYGGLELGLALALENPLRVVAVEIEAYALANLVAKAEAGKLAIEALWPVVRTFPAERFRGVFDFVIAGYPCQPFSFAGKRAGGTDERHLWPDICSIIESVKPVYVCTENVSGLVSGRILDNRPDIVEYLTALAAEERKTDARGRWYIGRHRQRLTARLLQQEGIRALAGVYLDLHDLGYKVEAGLFTAEECGAPHKRQRLFILSKKGDVSCQRLEFSQQEWPVGCSHRVSSMQYGDELAESESQRCREAGRYSLRHSIRATSTGGELADTERAEPGSGIRQEPPSECRGDRPAIVCWPALPGHPQYGWEEPRVVGDAEHTGQGRAGRTAQRFGEGLELQAEKTQSRVGSTVDGPSARVDQLRLLGNGVVPQQAEKAFRYLSNP